MYLGIVDQDIVLAQRVIRIHAERVCWRNQFAVDVTKLTVRTWQSVAPVPLLADSFNLHGIVRHIHEFGPDEKTRRQHRHNTDRRENRQPGFKLVILRVIDRFGALFGAVFEHRIGHKQVDSHKHEPGDPERDIDGVVNLAPIGSQRGECPRTDKMEHDSTNDQDDQHNC